MQSKDFVKMKKKKQTFVKIILSYDRVKYKSIGIIILISISIKFIVHCYIHIINQVFVSKSLWDQIILFINWYHFIIYKFKYKIVDINNLWNTEYFKLLSFSELATTKRM